MTFNHNKTEKIKFSFEDTIYSYLWLKYLKCSKKRWNQRIKLHEIYKEGVNAFNSELDWITIINSIRRLDSIFKSLQDSMHIKETPFLSKSIKYRSSSPIKKSFKSKLL